MTTGSRDDELANRVAALESQIEELRTELTDSTSSFPFPPPPSLEGILRFTDEIAIPGVILILETNIRMLKLLRRAIRLTDNESKTESATALSNDLSVYMTRTLGELENAITKLQSLETTRGPADETAQSILQEIRSLKTELSDEIDSNTDTTDTTGLESRHEEIQAELESIKEELEDQTTHRSPDDTTE